MVTMNTLTDSVFVAYRASKYNAIVYTCFSLVKVALPLVLISYGAYGIFFAYTGSVIVAIGLSLFLMAKKFGYRFHWNIERKTVTAVSKYSLSNYIASTVATAPSLVMPTLIVSHFGAAETAYYYMASTIAALLAVIPTATTQALLAEGSHDEEGIMSFVKGSAKLISALLLPAVAVLIVAGQFILAIFGKAYANESAALLDVMAITTIVVAANMVAGTILRIRHQIKELILMNVGYLIATALFVMLLLDKGVMGVTIGLLLGQTWTIIEYLLLFWYQKRRNKQAAQSQAA